MIKKGICIIAITLVLGTILSTPVTTYASEVTTNQEKGKPSDEEMKKMKEKMEAAAKKWDALTDAQKKEVYTLMDSQQKIMNQLLDKYVELGIMDKTEVAEMKKNMSEGFEKMKESGQFPMQHGEKRKK